MTKTDNKTYTVYVHINKVNNKAYVGQTCQSVQARWRKNGKGYKGQTKFINAIEKYGWDNFDHIILATGLTFEEADKKEQEYVKLYDSINNGYNIQEGGHPGGPDFSRPWKNHKREEIPIPEIEPYIKSKDKYENLGQGRRGQGSHLIICVNNGQVFETMKAAAEWANVTPEAISDVCRHETTSSGNSPETGERLVWQYLEEYEKNPIKLEDIELFKKPTYNSRKVLQLDPNTLEVLNVYNSITEAGRAIGHPNLAKNFKSIVKNNYTAYSYKWRYSEDN